MKPIFESIGLQVIRSAGGVYLFNAPDSKRQFVGLLFSSEILTNAAKPLQLFLYELQPGVDAEQVFFHWQNLDARRLEQSGLFPQPIEISAKQIPPNYPSDMSAQRKFARPNGDGERFALLLATGELVCYN